MQQSFPAAYQAAAEGARGPRIPQADASDRESDMQDVIKAVLKKKGSDGATYSMDERLAFFWYRYLFLGRGKPTTHILAVSSLTDEQVKAGCPKVFHRLLAKMKESLGMATATEAPNAD
jgi:putative ATP-dependent endonuclease of OLD family